MKLYNRKKIALIGTAGLPATYGGFETLAEYLTKNLADEYDITVYCSSKGTLSKLKRYNGARLKYLPLKANGIQSIFYDAIAIFNALFYADVLLILGVSGCISLPLVRLISKKRVIVNIDGLEWKRAKWGKVAQDFLKYSEKLAIKYADVIVADNKVIQNYVMQYYKKKSELIAYGADHCYFRPLSPEIRLEYPFVNNPYVFKVCRIEPENNIHTILDAFSGYPELPITIVGNWGNSDYGRQLKSQYDSSGNIHLLDSIYEQDKLNQLRSNCHIYIHGHSAGGTNPSLVEAMFLQLPIIAFDVKYNRETTNNKALYFSDAINLRQVLKSQNGNQLKRIGDAMKFFADENYIWKSISRQYARLFKE